jgi:hypothetical protein
MQQLLNLSCQLLFSLLQRHPPNYSRKNRDKVTFVPTNLMTFRISLNPTLISSGSADHLHLLRTA